MRCVCSMRTPALRQSVLQPPGHVLQISPCATPLRPILSVVWTILPTISPSFFSNLKTERRPIRTSRHLLYNWWNCRCSSSFHSSRIPFSFRGSLRFWCSLFCSRKQCRTCRSVSVCCVCLCTCCLPFEDLPFNAIDRLSKCFSVSASYVT